MTLIIRTYEEAEASLSHGAILCTKEQLDEYYLMHYRTRGSKNGERRYQDEHGRLTPEGYQHYAEMYGWNKKLNKISKTEEKSDRLKAKGDKADLKAAKAKLKYDKAEIEANSAARRVLLKGAPTNKAGADVQSSISANANYRAADYLSKQARADKFHLKALKLDKKAVKLADQLQRKENKMEKYVDENGMLNEKALDKYTYATGVPGERKMSLVGRMKFGNEYSKKFEEKYAESEKKRIQEEADSAEKKVNKLRDEFDSLPEGSQDRINTLDQVNSYIGSVYSGRLHADDKTLEDLERWFASKKAEENESMHNLYKRLDGYDKMSDSEKSKVGSRVLDEIAAQTRDYRTEDDSYAWDTDALQNWLIEKVYEKSGSINAGDYKPGTNAAKAQEKADDTYKKQRDREEQIMAKNGIENRSDVKNQERLEKLLKKDSVWKNLDIQWTKDNNEVMGAILKDLGFPDTPRYRSILYAYGWWD